MDIPGLSTLYAILKRDIEAKNDALLQRKELGAELRENCKKWAALVATTIESVTQGIEDYDYRRAEKAITSLLDDFQQVDYKFLREDSPILVHLAKDERFVPFVDACAEFYKAALDLKRLVYASIPDASGTEIRMKEHGLSIARHTWISEVERMLDRVNREYMNVKVLSPN